MNFRVIFVVASLGFLPVVLVMNLPNKLTVSRIVLSPIFMVFLLVDGPHFLEVALGVFLLAAVTDIYDGYLARRMGILTSFGKFMDPLADKLLVSVALIGLLARDVPGLPGWAVVVIVSRELVITGFRSLAAYRGVVISASRMARAKTVLQMTLVGWILARMTFFGRLDGLIEGGIVMNQFLGEVVLLVLLWSAVLLTTLTGLDYLVRNRAVIVGALRQESPPSIRQTERGVKLSDRWRRWVA